jgi:hypothetical protein
MAFRTITESEARTVLANEEADMLPFQFINDAGLDEIHAFLAEHHKLGGEHFNRALLRAWAADAEFQLGEGNGPSIEIRSFDSVSGHTETFTVSPVGVEWGINV